MLTTDSHTPRASSWLPGASSRLVVSDWTLTEFSSALELGVRVGRLTTAGRDTAEAALQSWHDREPFSVAVEPNDIRAARHLVRATALPLRAGDALHLAIAKRLGCSVGTFDVGMRDAGADLGLPIEALYPHA